jgi:hypothetical protein
VAVISKTTPESVNVTVVGGVAAVSVGEVGLEAPPSHAAMKIATPNSPARCAATVPVPITLARVSLFICAIPPV